MAKEGCLCRTVYRATVFFWLQIHAGWWPNYRPWDLQLIQSKVEERPTSFRIQPKTRPASRLSPYSDARRFGQSRLVSSRNPNSFEDKSRSVKQASTEDTRDSTFVDMSRPKGKGK